MYEYLKYGFETLKNYNYDTSRKIHLQTSPNRRLVENRKSYLWNRLRPNTMVRLVFLLFMTLCYKLLKIMKYIVDFDNDAYFKTSMELQIGDVAILEEDFGEHRSIVGKIIKRELFHYTDGETIRETLHMTAEVISE